MGSRISKSHGVENTLSLERREVPKWVCKTLGVTPSEVCQLEVTSASKPLFSALTKYLAQRGVDIGNEPVSLEERIHDDPCQEQREYPGKLTSFQTPKGSVRRNFQPYFRGHEASLEQEEEKLLVNYAIGYGWGCVKTDHAKFSANQIVIFQLYSRGEPIEEARVMNVHRSLVLYAVSDQVIKALDREALSWFYNQQKVLFNPYNDTYVLHTLLVLNDDCSPIWVCHGHRLSRPISSIVLSAGVHEKIRSDALSFFDPASKRWYRSHGIPYRRSYLFHGSPGTGKTSTIVALAGELRLRLCFVTLSHPNCSDQTLVEAMSSLPTPCILVFEDVDALFKRRRSLTKSSLTFSGLLNGIDGMIATEATLIVITTNHLDQLDSQLTRPGRVDCRFEFSQPGREEIARYYGTHYRDAPEDYSRRFADVVCRQQDKSARSLATLEQYFMHCREDLAEIALEKIDDFLDAS